MLKLFFLLIFGHCLADTSLQTEFMAKGKNRNRPVDLSRVPPGQKPIKLWWMWLTHHAIIQGGVVCIITGSLLFGVMETISHWVIDFYKCESKYSPYEDQAMHLLMKVFYIILLKGGVN